MSSSHRDALSAAHHAQLEDLVHRNRTLDQTIKRLRQELDREHARADNAVAAINAKWSRERAEWRAGCDTLIACHSIAHLRTTVALDAERVFALGLAKAAREHQLIRLQRDYRITLFQIRESEQAIRITELEDELGELIARNDLAQQKSAAQFAGLSALSTAEHDALHDLQEKHAQTLQELASLRTSAESTASQLERTALQLDGAQTTNAELTHANEDLKRTNADLRRQLDKWQTLETKGGAEVDAQRRRRIELEVHAKTLEARISDAEKREVEISAALEKEMRKTEKLKVVVADWKQVTEEVKEDEKKHRAEAVEASRKVEKQQKMIEKLKADLEAERARMRPFSPVKPNAPELSKRSSRDLPKVREEEHGEDTASAIDEDEVLQEIAASSPVRVPAAKTRGRPKPKPAIKGRVASEPEASTSDVEVLTRTTARRGNRKGKGKAEMNADEEDEPEIVERKAKPDRGKGKRKAVDDEDDEEEVGGREVKAIVPSAKTIGKRKAERDADAGGDRTLGRGAAKGSRAPSRAGSVQPTDGTRDGETVARKKKRTINIFGSAQDTTFAWGQLSQASAELGIPTALSPVKESEVVPNRSASLLGRMGSVIGSFRR